MAYDFDSSYTTDDGETVTLSRDGNGRIDRVSIVGCNERSASYAHRVLRDALVRFGAKRTDAEQLALQSVWEGGEAEDEQVAFLHSHGAAPPPPECSICRRRHGLEIVHECE